MAHEPGPTGWPGTRSTYLFELFLVDDPSRDLAGLEASKAGRGVVSMPLGAGAISKRPRGL